MPNDRTWSPCARTPPPTAGPDTPSGWPLPCSVTSTSELTTPTLSIHTDARNAAGQTGDRAAEAYALANLGVVHMRQGRYERAAEHYRRALSLFRETGDRGGEARTLANLGVVYLRQSRYEQAAGVLGQALILFRETGNRIGEGYALAN